MQALRISNLFASYQERGPKGPGEGQSSQLTFKLFSEQWEGATVTILQGMRSPDARTSRKGTGHKWDRCGASLTKASDPSDRPYSVGTDVRRSSAVVRSEGERTDP